MSTAEQLTLFPEEPKNGFSDPSFASNKERPVHRWVPWIAGFSSEFVRDAIDRYTESGGMILDPFSGVGTTLVESMIAGHGVIGFEINPYAALACRVKTSAQELDADIVRINVDRLTVFCDHTRRSDYTPQSMAPEGFRTWSPFYSPAVLRKVLTYLDFVQTIENEKIADLFRLAFAATMIRYSNYSYEPSLGRRVSAGKEEIEDYPVVEAISNKLREIADDIAWMQEAMPSRNLPHRVINDTFFRYREYVEPGVADLLVTSPPYLNNYHYNRNTRPHLYWLGFVDKPQDMKPLEQMNFGSYWQTVRELERVDLEFTLPGSDLEERLEYLRTLNTDRGAYGGNGWANYAAAYFNDCLAFSKGIKYVLKPGATALVVIGNSILQGVMIPTDQYFGAIAESTGLELVDIHIPRAARVGDSIIRSDVRVAKAKKTHQLYEAVVEIRKAPVSQ